MYYYYYYYYYYYFEINGLKVIIVFIGSNYLQIFCIYGIHRI